MSKDVVSLPIAKKLKEAGWAGQDSMYAYCSEPDCAESTPIARPDDRYCESCGLAATQDIQAPSCGELLEALPNGIQMVKQSDGLFVRLGRYQVTGGRLVVEKKAPNPADALALLWMALKEKNLV